MIELLRIDHRLLHGQVAFSWSKQIGTDCILLACDSLLNDKLRMSAIKMAKPSGIKVVAKTINDSIEAIKSGITDKYKLFVVVESIKDADALARALDIKTINIGGAEPEEGKHMLSKAVYVDEADENILKALVNDGFDVFTQMVPQDKRIETKELLK